MLLSFLLACIPDGKLPDSSDPEVAAFPADCSGSDSVSTMVEVNGLSLNVTCRGSGPTVLFLHGFPEFSYGWDKVMDELAGEYRLIAPDQRGYNLSDKPSAVSDYEIGYLVEDIALLIPLLDSDPVILVAHDWGGPVGWLVASGHPDLVRGFVGANAPHPTVFAQLLASDPAQQEASSYMDFFRTEGVEEILAGNEYGGMVSMFDGAIPAADIPIYIEAWSQPGALTGGLNWYRANDISEWLEPVTVEVPTRVLWGLDDSALLPQNLEGLADYVSDLEVSTFEGVDHWINHRIPSEIADQIRILDSETR